MKRKGVLCKALTTVESLGAVDGQLPFLVRTRVLSTDVLRWPVIASDKTGTLTQNRMSAVNLAIGASVFTITDARRGDINGRAAIEQLVAVAAICNEAHFADADLDLPPETRNVIGDATDTGLLRFAESVASVSDLRASIVEEDKLSFNSRNKYAVKLVAPVIQEKPCPSIFGEGENLVLLAKGAPDVLMRSCTSILMPNGSVRVFDDVAKERLVAVQSSFASRGQRVLLFARRSVSPQEHSERDGAGEDRLVTLISNLTVIGLVALVDPPKHDSRETVETCRRAGVRFFMGEHACSARFIPVSYLASADTDLFLCCGHTVTGDFALTAAAIAREIGIITSPPRAVKSYDHIANGFSHAHEDEKKDPVVEVPPEGPLPRECTSLVLSGPEMLKLTDEQWLEVLKVSMPISLPVGVAIAECETNSLTRSSSRVRHRNKSSRSFAASRWTPAARSRLLATA